jgi:thioredoxin 2
MGESIRHIVCPHCDAVNRVPGTKPIAEAKCGRCHKQLFEHKPVAVGSKSFMTHVQRNDVPVVVDFWAEWCGPCKAMAPAFERVAAEIEPSARFLKVDTEAAPDLAEQYKIRSIPTLMIFRDGVPAFQIAGAMNTGKLRHWVQQYIQLSPQESGR